MHIMSTSECWMLMLLLFMWHSKLFDVYVSKICVFFFMFIHENYEEENKVCYCYWNYIMFEPIMNFSL